MLRFNLFFNKLFHKSPVEHNDKILSNAELKALEDFKKNRIIVRVWTSAACGAKRLGKSVGHVSLQLNPYNLTNTFIKKESIKFYMSLWPRQAHDEKDFHLNSLEEDYVDEGPPQYTFYIHSLDKEAILKKYEELYSEMKSWNLFCKSDDNGAKCNGKHSCVSFVKTLLIAGGLNNLISANDIRIGKTKELLNDTKYAGTGIVTCRSDKVCGAIANSVEQIFSEKFNSPDTMVTLLQILKANEGKLFPLTQREELNNFEKILIPTYSFESIEDDSIIQLLKN